MSIADFPVFFPSVWQNLIDGGEAPTYDHERLYVRVLHPVEAVEDEQAQAWPQLTTRQN